MATPVFPSNDRLQDLSPAAGTTELSYDFELKSETGLSIERVRAGARSILANGVDYDFPAGLGDASGGTVTLSAATLAGDRYLLIGREPIARQSDLYDNNAFRAERYNEDGDFTTLIAQELRRDIDRAVLSDYGQPGLSIDTSQVTAGKVLMRGTGNDIVPGPDAEEIANAQTYADIALGVQAARALIHGVVPGDAYDASGGGVGSRRISNVADGINPQDVVTKAQFDASASGFSAAITVLQTNSPFLDDAHNTVNLGPNVRPTPVYDDPGTVLLAGVGTTAIGSDILTGAANNATYSTFVGSQSGRLASNVYCCEGYGLRTLEVVTDAQYVLSMGTDSCLKLGYGRNSAVVGAKACLEKSFLSSVSVLGVGACYYSGIADDVVAIGTDALAGRSTDLITDSMNDVVAIGVRAARYLRSSAGRNTFVGNDCAGGDNISGLENTGEGNEALINLRAGGSNTATGYRALDLVIDENNNSAHGAEAGPSALGLSNTGSYGALAKSTASNQITLGAPTIATLRCATTTITAISDRRDKDQIEDLSLGLDFIKAVRPKKFRWNMRDGSKVGDLEAGIIAQDLEQLQQDFDADWLGLVYDATPDRLEATPGKLIFPLIKAVQELSAMVEAQAAEIAALKGKTP